MTSFNNTPKINLSYEALPFGILLSKVVEGVGRSFIRLFARVISKKKQNHISHNLYTGTGFACCQIFVYSPYLSVSNEAPDLSPLHFCF